MATIDLTTALGRYRGSDPYATPAPALPVEGMMSNPTAGVPRGPRVAPPRPDASSYYPYEYVGAHDAGGSDFAPTAPAASRLDYSMDRSRGESGADWLRSHTPPRPADMPLPGGGAGYLFSGTGTQADFEGRANARRMIEDAYGPPREPFDPVREQLQALEGQAALKLAQKRAEDPLAFAQLEAALPEKARVQARIQAGSELSGVLGAWNTQLADLQQKRARLHMTPEYRAATPEARAAEDQLLDAEEARIEGHLRVMQQAMGFATGQTPSSLYAQGPQF